ncbi:class I SAM-dependent methyltransferase [Halochromatium glycolicum]|uniref:Class I SAM-dependent methyltransferase n=1 Tax=Halochromatium glycolicum TaxID=85075 RepID=A0AAJ0U157_9GAMM|nr:class I SAM-dependent methyltransferase [Halochromatium glycolicum]MBK1703363.1 hypothetical protein [Halochromatium glycolicum]
MTTLVFPSSTPAGRDYIRDALRRGETVLAASSLAHDAIAAEADWHRLPSIHDDGFDAALDALIAARSITRLYAPVTLVYAYLRDYLARTGRQDLAFVRPAPFYEAIEAQAVEARDAPALTAFARTVAEPGTADHLQPAHITGVLRHAFGVFGESYTDKLTALIGVLQSVPVGDAVEIGALFGRSTAVLLQALNLTDRANPVLVVDAWHGETAVQTSLPPALAAAAIDMDWSLVADSFDVNMVPLARPGRFNRLRLPSDEAFARYTRDRAVTSDLFGTTAYSGRIAFLHIDANHDYDAVAHDRDLWTGRLVPGAWVVFDDYYWSHGDGPGRAADEFCTALGPRLARSFYAGGALFVRLVDR